jgi:hypothetical protein
MLFNMALIMPYGIKRKDSSQERGCKVKLQVGRFGIQRKTMNIIQIEHMLWTVGDFFFLPEVVIFKYCF